jgi:hypothetical protein
MTQSTNARVTISFQDPELDEISLQEITQNLCHQITEVYGVEQADMIAVKSAPEGSRAIGGFLLGMLTAEVSPASIKALFSFLSDRLGGKVIEMAIETPDGKKLSIKASSKAEFDFATQQAKEFLA